MTLHSDDSTLAVKPDRTHVDWTGDKPAEILLEIPELKTPIAKATMRGGLAVVALVGAEYGFSIEELRSKDRHRTITEARKVAYWLLRQTKRFSYPEIGIVLNRDHTSAMHGFQDMEKKRAGDERIRAVTERLLAELTPGPRVEGFESGRFGR